MYKEKDYINGKGQNIHYLECGEGQPVMFIHGQGMCSEDFIVVFNALKDRYHIYSVDVPGHGASSRDRELYTCKSSGDILIEFAHEVIGEKYLIAGHSMGSIIGSYIAGADAENVQGLLMEDTPFFNVDLGEVEDSVAYKDIFAIIHEFLNQDQEKNFMLFYLPRSYVFSLLGEEKHKEVVEEAKVYISQHPGEPLRLKSVPDKMLFGWQYLGRYDFEYVDTFCQGSWFKYTDQEEILKSVKCPVVYLKSKTRWAEDGTLMSANSDKSSDWVVSLLADVERYELKCGHNIHNARPEEFIKGLDMVRTKIKI